VKGKTAGLLFLGICVALACLLIVKVITTILSGALFALALLILGVSSRGASGNRGAPSPASPPTPWDCRWGDLSEGCSRP
jgi:hypothetical protein